MTAEVNVTDVPSVPVVGPLMATDMAPGEITTCCDAVAVLALPSVVITDMVKVPDGNDVVKLAPMPDDGLPPVAVHANVYGPVPPDPVAVNVTAVPTVPVVGPAIVTARASGLIVTVAELVTVAADASVAATDIVSVPFAL